MKLHEPIELKTWSLIKDEAMALLNDQCWDYRSERLFRMPMSGFTFDEVNKELSEKGMPRIGMWTIFARGAGRAQSIHCDAFSLTERVDSGLVVPVLGVIGSKMQWFSEDGLTMHTISNPDGKSTLFRCVASKPPTVIEEIEVTTPILARLCVPHRAVASAFTPRAVVSIKLQGNPKLL